MIMWDDGDFSWMNDLMSSNSSPAPSESVDWSSYLPQAESYGYEPYNDYTYSNSDFVGPQQYSDTAENGYTYTPSSDYGPPTALMTTPSGGGIWDMMQQIGRGIETPGGKLGVGLFGAGISAYGANKANKQAKDAYKKQQQLLAQRQAKAAQYDSPLRLAMARQAAGAPAQRSGEGEFFTNNRLPSYFADGGGVSDEDYMRMQAEALQSQQEAQMDRPSMMGFLRYIAAGKKMPSEIAAAKRAQRPDVISERTRALREAAAMSDDQPVVQRACGGSMNYVRGGTAGQADKIPAQLSDGEYVMDADVVSALGDGNNEAGAAKLDQMREGIRAHKRSAPANKIPPKAKSPLAYMKKGAK